MQIELHERYVQLAFNGTIHQVSHVLRQIKFDKRILIEAGTPYIKTYGIEGIKYIRRLWKGPIVADLKVADGAVNEVLFASQANANAITVLGSAPTETLDFFNMHCKKYNLYSMIDMIGVENPLRKLLPLKNKPDFVIIHKGRDEESNARTIIRYKDISKIRSKFNTFIAVAGGLDENNIRSAYFNGADVVILNIISSNDPNNGLLDTADFTKLMPKLLSEVGQ